jgi:hypothetical protein
VRGRVARDHQPWLLFAQTVADYARLAEGERRGEPQQPAVEAFGLPEVADREEDVVDAAHVDHLLEYLLIVVDTIASNIDLHYLRWTTTVQDYSGGQGMWINGNGSFAGFLPTYAERNNASDQVSAIYVTGSVPDTTAPEVDAVDPWERLRVGRVAPLSRRTSRSRWTPPR